MKLKWIFTGLIAWLFITANAQVNDWEKPGRISDQP